MSKHIDLARKLKALADKGVGGEKVTAEAMLNALLKKHKITIEEIEGEKLEDHYFTLTKEEFRLWYQIVKQVRYALKVYGEFPKKFIRQYSLDGNWMITCSASEFIEIEAKYSFYKRLFEQELDVFYSAFIKANDLLVDNPNKTADKEMSMEDYLEWKRIDDMSKKIKSESFRKQLQ